MSIIERLTNSKNIKLCENCDIKAKNKVIWICLKDKDLLCGKCKISHMNLGRLHTFMEYKEYQKETFFLKYNEYLESIFPNKNERIQYNLDMDRKNKFLLIDLENKKIAHGQKWMQTGMPDDRFQTISFVGLSGSGKTTTIGPLCKNNDHPIPASLDSSCSTSSDINAYIGETIGEEKRKYLILDSEGTGGTHNLSTMGVNDDTMDCKNNHELIKNASKSRLDFVNHSYPRLLYLISDIMVFVFNGQREKKLLHECLLQYGKSSSNVSNNLVRPHLIILLNNKSVPDEFYDTTYAKKEYFQTEEDKLKDLNIYFQSVSLIYFPNFDSSIKVYKDQFLKLELLFNEKLNESLEFKRKFNFDTSKSSNMERILKVIGFFNRIPNGTPDMQLLNCPGTRKSTMFDSFKINPTVEMSNSLKNTKIPINSNNNLNNINSNNNIDNNNNNNNNNNNVKTNSSSFYTNTIDLLKDKQQSSGKTQILIDQFNSKIPSTKSDININTKRNFFPPNEIYNRFRTESLPSYPSKILNSIVSISKEEEIKENIKNYFKAIYMKSIESDVKSRLYGYNNSLNHLKSRLPKTYLKFIKRNGITQPPQSIICEQFKEILVCVSIEIEKLSPCCSKNNGKECTIFKETHQSVHQSSVNVELNGANETNNHNIPPLKWIGEYISPFMPSVYDLCAYVFETKQINSIPNFSGLKSCYTQVCFGCLLDSPIIPYSCEHVLCIDCSNENSNNQCPICNNGYVFHRKEIDVNPNIGARILTLDGGGIRGIVECIILEKIKKELFDTKIHELFDIIVGTSTGGLIALSLASNKKSPIELVETFENMGKKAFVKNGLKKLPLLEYLLFWIPKYKREDLRACFVHEFGKKQTKDSFLSTRVAVTSATVEESFIGCVFTNYLKKVPLSEQPRFIYNADCVSAAEATSAAPTYFSSFEFEGRTFYDGGIVYNNPCIVALQECKSLWGNKSIDIFLSLGTGNFPKKTQSNGLNVFNLFGKLIELVFEVEKDWENIHGTNKELKKGSNSFRLNPNFENEINLDDIQSIEILKSVTNSFISTRNETIVRVVNKCLSSLFYVDNLNFNSTSKVLIGNIKYRLGGDLNQKFEKQFSNGQMFDLSRKLPNTSFKILKMNSNPFLISFRIDNPPDEIDIICKLQSLSLGKNETSISNCPFKYLKQN